MKNGFYLATYVEINKIGNAYEMAQRHDQNISLWKKINNDVFLIHYWELERVSGIKHHRLGFKDIAQAKQVINTLLAQYGLTLDDMIEIWGTPELQTCDDYHSIAEIPDFTYHIICHAFSTIMMDTDKFFNENILALATDLGSDTIVERVQTKKNDYVGCVIQNGIINYFPIMSPAMLWHSAKNVFSMQEGTLMALASASQSKFLYETDEFVEARFHDFSLVRGYFAKLEKRMNSITDEDKGVLFNGWDLMFSERENRISMAMKEIESMSIKIMERNIDYAITTYGINPADTYLALAGGFALNCPTNSYLMKKYKFKGFIAPPTVSDTGQSLGIALYAFYKKMGRFKFDLGHAYYGDRSEEIEELLSNGLYKEFVKQVSDFDAYQAVQDIQDSPVVWVNGAAEIGPRALGNRSILSDSRTQAAKDKLNQIKQRQWWRPVAPIVLEEDIAEWFEDAYPSPFMLHTFAIKEDKLPRIPAVAHIDGTARIQSISRDSTELFLYELVSAFKEATGIPMICNTSLNDKGEPIINSAEEALNFALRKGIRIVYLNGKRLELQNHAMYALKTPQLRPINIFMDDQEKAHLMAELNPHNVSKDAIAYYALVLHGEDYDLTRFEEARGIELLVKMLIKKIGEDFIFWN